MNVYELYIKDHVKGVPRYDVCYAFVIVAKDETTARMMAERAGEDETRLGTETLPFWMDASKTECVLLDATAERCVMRDTLNG